jgi:hypothetical protein
VVQAKELNYRNTISVNCLIYQLYGIMLKTGYVKRMPNSPISMIILENIFQNSINQNLASVKNTGFIMPICGEVFLVQDFFYHATNML